MKWRYKCTECDCNLDPGEGSLCSDCKEELNKVEKKLSYNQLRLVEKPIGQLEILGALQKEYNE